MQILEFSSILNQIFAASNQFGNKMLFFSPKTQAQLTKSWCGKRLDTDEQYQNWHVAPDAAASNANPTVQYNPKSSIDAEQQVSYHDWVGQEEDMFASPPRSTAQRNLGEQNASAAPPLAAGAGNCDEADMCQRWDMCSPSQCALPMFTATNESPRTIEKAGQQTSAKLIFSDQRLLDQFQNNSLPPLSSSSAIDGNLANAQRQVSLGLPTGSACQGTQSAQAPASSSSAQLNNGQVHNSGVAIMTEETAALKTGIEDPDKIVEDATANDLCHDEDTYTNTAALNPGAHRYASEKEADADDQISKFAQTPAATKIETSQPGSTQCSNLCKEESWTAAERGLTTSADRHAVTLHTGVHMYVRDDPTDANDWTKTCATTSQNQHGQFFATQFSDSCQGETSRTCADLEEEMPTLTS